MVKKTTYKLLPAQWEFLFGEIEERLDKGEENFTDVSCYQGGFTCVPADTEYLSPTGWKRIENLTKDDKLAVYSNSGSITYECPLEVFKWKADKWYEFHTRTLWQKVCPNHKMVTWTPSGVKRSQSMSEYYEEHCRLKNGHAGMFRTTFDIDSKESTNLNKDELRFLVAFQADGYLYETRDWSCGFHFCKERKFDRIINLCKKLGYKYKIGSLSSRDYRVYVNAPKELLVKEFSNSWYNLSQKELETIIDELPYWDGMTGKTHNSYYTSSKTNADFIQFAGSACGYRSTISTRTRPSVAGTGKLVTEYRVNFCTNITPSLQATRNKAEIVVTDAKEGEYKYCPSTSTGMWLARYKNYIFVTGNSGKTFSGSLRGLLYALRWAGCKGLVGAIRQELLDGTTKIKYTEHLENIGMKQGEHWWFTDKGNTIMLKNGSSIKFKTLSDWEQLRSYEFTWIEFEEASLLPERAFEEMMARIREQKREGWKRYHRSMFLHTNPGGARGWIYKLFTNKKTKIDGYRIVFAATKENKHLGENYENDLKKLYGADDVEQFLMGRDVDNDNSVAFPLFDESNTLEGIKLNPNYPLILSCDFNYNPMCWYLMQEIDGVWYVLKELIEQNVTTRQMCERVLPAIQEFGVRNLVIMGDAHGRDKKTNGSDYGVMLPFFSQRGFNVTLSVAKYNPAIKERLSLLRGCICNGLRERKLFIDADKCPRLLYNFDECKVNLATGGLRAPTDKEIQDDIDKLYLIHPIDAISYPIWFKNKMHDFDT